MQDPVSDKRGRVAAGALWAIGMALWLVVPAFGQAPPPKQAVQQPPPAGQAAGQPAAQNPASDQPPVSKEEEDAYRAIYGLTAPQGQQIISQSEDFLAKYPSSRYRTSVYSRLVTAYLNSHQNDKMIATAQKAIAENPDNVDVLALVSTVIPRTIPDPRALDAEQKLTEAERYAKRAIELASSLPKPDGVTEEQFTAAKNEKLGLAHYGLGLVYYMRGNSTLSVPELEQASRLDPRPEPLLFYLLGRGEIKLKKYPEALTAFDTCAKAQWDPQWQARCKSGADEAKQAAATAAKP